MSKQLRSKRWSEADELKLIKLYEKYQTPDKKFNVSLIKDHELIGNRSRSAHAAKMLHDYQIRSIGVTSEEPRAFSRTSMAKDFADGMSKDDVKEKYEADEKIVDFVMQNVENILTAGGRKQERSEQRLNFKKPKWTLAEDIELMRIVNQHTQKNGDVNWVSVPADINMGDNRNKAAMQKRWQNNLKNRCEWKNKSWHLEVHGVIPSTNGNRINIVEQKPAPEVPPLPPSPPNVADRIDLSKRKKTPPMITKSYLWGMYTVTKPA